jgi:hypothetical protein
MTDKTLQQSLAEIQRELRVPKNQKNTFGNYNYRSCEDILEALKPHLNGFSLIISDEVVNIGERYYVKATVSFGDGKEVLTATAYAREAEIKKGMDEAQITGSASSYARKYALNGLFAIDDTKDADSMDNTKHEVKTVKPTVEPEEELKICSTHETNMVKGHSASKNKDYWYHRNENKQICFGSGYQE